MTQGVINDCIFIEECGYNIWTVMEGRELGNVLIVKFQVNVAEM